MANSSKQEIIETVEQNYKSFNNILITVKGKSSPDQALKENQLKSFFGTLVAIEEDVIELRLKKIIKEEHPYLPAINVQQIKEQNFYDREPLNKLIDKFLVLRQQLCQFIQQIPFFEWDRTGFHELEGHVSFEEFVRRIIKNDQRNISYLRKDLNN
jgi:hypothetical protein